MLRTGIDLIEIARLERINPSIRRRFLERVFTPLELEQADDSNSSLAGRFAAKEAAAKTLGCGIGAVSWQELEIVEAGNGAPNLRLHGKAASLAAELGLTEWSVSISHSQTQAVAVVVAMGKE